MSLWGINNAIKHDAKPSKLPKTITEYGRM